MLLRQHGGDPCAFRFGVDAGFGGVHADSATQHVERTPVFASKTRVVAMQHGVVVVALGRHQGHDTGRGHGVGDIAEILGTTGTGPVNEQTSRAWPGSADRFT